MNMPEISCKKMYNIAAYDDIMSNTHGLYKKEIRKKIIDIAYNFPMDSEEFIEGMEIIKTLNEFTGYVLCHDRIWEDDIPDAEITRCTDDRKWKDILSETHTFCDSPYHNDRFNFKKRNDVEFDVRYRQVCVGVLITDYKNIICLKTHDRGRLPNMYTLIQGHVDFDKTAYTTSQSLYIRNNALREIYEEIKIKNPGENDLLLGVDFQINNTPDFIINVKRTLTNLEHMGFVYVIRINDCTEAMELIESNESKKHDVVMLPLVYNEQMDEWLNVVIKEITK